VSLIGDAEEISIQNGFPELDQTKLNDKQAEQGAAPNAYPRHASCCRFAPWQEARHGQPWVSLDVRPQPPKHHINMFGMFKKKKKADERFSQPLSPEADKFLAEALEEYGQKEEALEQGWRLSACAEYALNDETGLFHMKLDDGTSWEADAQILGSFNEDDSTWQWAWGNPHCAEIWSRDSKLVKAAGEQLDIWYVHEMWDFPVPGPEYVAYLNAIGVKASGSAGWYEVRDGSVVIFVLLKNLRWTTDAAHSAAAVAAHERQELELTAGIRRIKAGEDDLIPAWNKQFARSEVYVISIAKDDPSKLMVLGPKDQKNLIAVFTDKAGLEKAIGGRDHILFPIEINGRALLEQAKDSGRGLIINPTDESAAVPLPPQMMGVFLEGISIA